MSEKEIFAARQFTPTQFSAAQRKADFCNRLARFVLAGCSERLFTQALYRRLILTFNHVSHNNRQGFWNVWLATEEKKRHFLGRLMRHQAIGNPTFDFSDAERIFVEWLRRQGGLHEA